MTRGTVHVRDGRYFMRSRLAAISAALGLVAALLFAVPAGATPGPIVQRSGAQMTADALPTTQVDGVVWSQAVVGNTVYAGGSFGTARPAGAAPGVSTVVRSNLLSYDIRTGVLNTGFAPSLERSGAGGGRIAGRQPGLHRWRFHHDQRRIA